VDIVKYDLALLFTTITKDTSTSLDVIAHLYCYVDDSVLTTQLPQDYTCKTKHNFPYTIVSAPYEAKQLHECGNNSRESAMVPTTNSVLTQRQLSCW